MKKNMERWVEKLMLKHALSEDDIKNLLAIGEKAVFKAGSYVVRAGEVNENIYIITSGVWREYCFKDGEEATIWFSVSGEITFSVWGYVGGESSHLFIESMTESSAIFISRKQLDELFSKSLSMANLGRRIIENFALLYERWHIQMWRQNALERYLSLLDEYPEVIQKIPMKYIASYLGITAQSLSRIRASLM